MIESITFHDDKILEVLLKLQDKEFFIRKAFSADPPEMDLPEGIESGTKEHAQYLFIGIGFDQRRQSKHVYRAAREIISQHSLEDIAEMDYNPVRKIVKKALDDGLSDPTRMLMSYAKIITDKYDGDPRNIFSDAKNFLEARKRLLSKHCDKSGNTEKMYGMGPYKASLVIKNYARFGYINLDNPYDGTPKVDIHFTRMMVGNGGIEIKGEGEVRVHKLHKELDTRSHRLCIENEIDWITADDFKWRLGNACCNRKSYQLCYDKCPMDCTQLVQLNKSGSYIIFPSETRKKVQGVQMGLFNDG